MYGTRNLTQDQISIIESDPEMKETLSTIKILSEDFTVDDADAIELDEMVMQWLGNNKPKENKPKATKKTPTKKTSSLPEKKDNKADLIAMLIEQISQSESVSPEQVSIIVENTLKANKIGFNMLTDDVVKAIKAITTVKLETPKFPNTKTFKSETAPQNFQKVIDDVFLGNNVMLIGGAGTGKTYMAEMVANILGLPTETINCNQYTSPIEILGGQTIEGYQEGKLINAWSQGKLLILDEMPKLDPNTAGLLNEALAKTNLSPDDERAQIQNTRGDVFRKKKGFGVIATGNVYPNSDSMSYSANNKQDLSLLDRFSGSVYEIEKNPEYEQKEILEGDLLIWKVADAIRTLIEQNAWDNQVSIRFMQSSRNVLYFEKQMIEKNKDMSKHKTYKDSVDSLIYTFTEPQQKEIKSAINYSSIFADYQYRKMDIKKLPF